MSTLPNSPAPQVEAGRSRFVMRGLRSAAFGAAIAVAIWGLSNSGFWPALVQSVCIALCCWLFIDLGRVPLARWAHRHAPPDTSEALRHWPGWPLMAVAIGVGSLLGFRLGSAVAELILGQPLWRGYFRGSLREAMALVVASFIPGTLITYWFYSRETIAAKEAAMQVAQRQAAEHQLKLLESQLEPHMLFNTLANLRVLIALDPPRAQAMLDQLIAFLRATLNASRQSQHPLRAEFSRLEDYLALMRVRMGERLHTHFELPEALAELQIPALLLQPLVENSIKHGLEPAVEGGRIEVRAERLGNTLVLQVRDTGVGLAGPADAGTRFGLVQVRERLATLYGVRASLTLEPASVPGGGTLATIRLPLDPLAPCGPTR